MSFLLNGYFPRKVNPVVKRTGEEFGLSFSRSPALAGLDLFLQAYKVGLSIVVTMLHRTVTHWWLRP
jgi:hypothetical protein